MDEKTRRRFIGRADGANAIALSSPTALTHLEEEILHQRDDEVRAGAQAILLASQDALRMFPSGVHQRFYWIAVLPLRRVSESREGFPPETGLSLWKLLNAALERFDNPVTAAFYKASGQLPAPLTCVLHSTSRLDAETRAWLSFYSCLAPQIELVQNYVGECFMQRRQSRSLAVFLPIADPNMTFAQLYDDPPRPLGPPEQIAEIEAVLRGQVAKWNAAHAQYAVEVTGSLQRISQVVANAEEQDLRASFLETLESKAPLQKVAEISDKPLQPVIGSLRSAKPHPGQMVSASLCDAESARCLTFGAGALLAGTKLLLAKKVIEDILTEAGIAFEPPIVLPPGPLYEVLSPGDPNFKLPCADGAYRSITQSFFGKAGWQIKDVDWDQGWRWDMDSFASPEAVREIGSLPHPIALSVAGAESALRAHYERGFLDRLREQMAIPGRCQHVAMDSLYDWLPDLVDVEDQFEDAVEPRTGIYAAEHWRLAKGALFVVRNSLTIRLEETDFEDKFPAKYIHSPYSDAYFHFETPLSHDIDRYTQFLITGFYVSEEPAANIPNASTGEYERLLVVNLTYRYTDETVRFGSIPVSFPIEKDDERFIVKTYSDAVAKTLQANPMPPEAKGEMEFCLIAMAMVIKVLLYANMKNARMDHREEKTAALVSFKKLSGAKKNRESERVRRLFDYIVLGPEETQEDRIATDLHARKMKVHWRKGFIRNQRHGPGLAETKQIWIAPVLVNAADLEKDQAAPDIPPYIIE